MNSKEYRIGVLRTESGRFDSHHIEPHVLNDVLTAFIEAGKALDAIKRGLYYGKQLNYQKLDEAMAGVFLAAATYGSNRVPHEKNSSEENTVQHSLSGFPADSNTCPSVPARIVHAAFGLGTESAEIIEKVLESFRDNTSFDYANLFEEISDISWYKALAIDTASHSDENSYSNGGTREWTHESIWEKNLDKLKARYPDKFSTDKAYERDLQKEKEALGDNPSHK